MKIKIAYSYYSSIIGISLFLVSIIIFILNDEIEIFYYLSRSLNIALFLMILTWLLIAFYLYQSNGNNKDERDRNSKVKSSLLLSVLIIPTFYFSTLIAIKLTDIRWENNHPFLEEVQTCEEGHKLAKGHENEGELGIILGGITFPENYSVVLRNNYNIKTYIGGCIVSPGEECYNEYMYKIIRDKYGEDCFEIALKVSNESNESNESKENSH